MASNELTKWDFLTPAEVKVKFRQLAEELAPLPGILPVVHLLLRVITKDFGPDKISIFKAEIEKILSESEEKPGGTAAK